MNKKFLGLFLIAVGYFGGCSPAWAEDDNPWDNVIQFKAENKEQANLQLDKVRELTNSDSQPKNSNFNNTNNPQAQLASPLDGCNGNPFTLDCTNSCFLGPFPGGWVWRYQDPKLADCPEPIYPYQVEFLQVFVSNCANVDCEIVLNAGIYAIDTTEQVCPPGGPVCPKPGQLLCLSDPAAFEIPALSECTPIGYDMGFNNCCVNGPYFIGVQWTCPADGHCQINPCLEIFGSDTCGTWYWDCDPDNDTLNFRCDLNLPNACIQTSGRNADQNNCAAIEDTACAITNLCVRVDSLRPCAQANPLATNRRYFSFQDPKKACPLPPGCPTYPFEVDAIHLMLSNCGTDTGLAVIEPAIYSAHYPTDTLCPEPDSLICQGPPFTVKIPPGATCKHFILPLSDTCCVDTSYFAYIKIAQTGGDSLRICIDSSCMPYWNYVQFPIHTKPVDPCPLGLTGDFAMWTSGFPFCKNNCSTRDNRGIDSVSISPGPTPDSAKLNIFWYAQLDMKWDFAKNFSCSLYVSVNGIRKQSLFKPLFYSPSTSSRKSLSPGVCGSEEPPCTFQLCPEDYRCVQFESEEAGTYCICETLPSEPVVLELQEGVITLEVKPSDICLTHPELCPIPPPFFVREHYLIDDKLEVPFCVYKPGDVNRDGMYNLSDIVGEVNIVFKGVPKPPLTCLTDANADAMTNLTDIIYDVNHVFKGGPKPKASGVCCK